eukprot:CAMPEP_0173401454 /NCGR_PEP_ID=MMETSP1356-20130122/50956_1 /TAXON_ID=77927 ORGANISM="Hemiselmis virescens, Strain PCC157" /NCGR_SAMPLE_ID=MMETSP1356 /ASSEMBLY_ACC=CAM_ASM_000847 /LENGTH=44 /DNA_ID= /DNA_START= /DNA_END= /DNA_ORIENTATION=
MQLRASLLAQAAVAVSMISSAASLAPRSAGCMPAFAPGLMLPLR